MRNLISNVENAYWDLYFAYRDLHAKIVARDSALETWRRIHALYVTGRRGGEADKEAQARDQYYFFQAEVEDALDRPIVRRHAHQQRQQRRHVSRQSGRVRHRATAATDDGPAAQRSSAHSSRRGASASARLLRLGSDRQRSGFASSRVAAATRGGEARELALIAAQNFLLPRLDAEGLYRWRGLGHTLLNYGPNLPPFDNAFTTLFGGQFQEWQLAANFDMPIGFRQGHAAVRNAQLLLARERAVLREQELQVVHDLSNVIGDVDRAYTVAQTNYNRRVAAEQQMAAVQAAFEADTASLLDLVESQRRLADADSRYARSMVEYTLAVKNVMFESNTLLRTTASTWRKVRGRKRPIRTPRSATRCAHGRPA